MVACSCARMGTGLVTILATKESADVYRITLPPHLMVRDDLEWFDERVSALIFGSGGLPGIEPNYCSNLPVVLDADALANLPTKLSANYVLTPHEGEFHKAFPNLDGTKIERALQAATESGAYVVLKGPDTVIASPDGQHIVNDHASPWLATAGSGDVLAGMIGGLAAQQMPLFEACCAAVWIHGEAAQRFGIGLVASDLPAMIPQVLGTLVDV